MDIEKRCSNTNDHQLKYRHCHTEKSVKYQMSEIWELKYGIPDDSVVEYRCPVAYYHTKR